ncbi:hypothetical protein APTSU1_000665500 [Apodemus speciosus]|uniref:Uncharacterized protein n=1 Tax=Apodemus speciosus TaxID=105296 RepID=A0ABQ0EX17_APOSI
MQGSSDESPLMIPCPAQTDTDFYRRNCSPATNHSRGKKEADIRYPDLRTSLLV